MKKRIRHLRVKLVMSGTPKTPVSGVSNTGHPRYWNRGVPVHLGQEADGREIIFWSRGDKVCRICGGSASYARWRAHMRRYVITPLTSDGRRLIRYGLRCPMLTIKQVVTALGPDPSYYLL